MGVKMWSWFVEAQQGTLLLLWHSWKLGSRNEHLISYYTMHNVSG